MSTQSRVAIAVLMAVAAVAFAALSIFTWMDRQPPVSDDIVLREGTGSGGLGDEGKITLLPVAKRADHRAELRWSEVEGADAYTVHLFSVELDIATPYASIGPDEFCLDVVCYDKVEQVH